jgi:hypothetical protein
VRYMLLIYRNPADWVGPSRRELTESGEWVAGAGLAPAAAGRTVRVRGGVPVVTDGPVAGAEAELAGYVLVECDGLERAVEIAARWPDPRHGAVEVRPVMRDSADEI